MPLKTLTPEKLEGLRSLTQMPELRERANPKLVAKLESILEQYQDDGTPFPINRYSPIADRMFGVPPWTQPEDVGGTQGIYSPTEASVWGTLFNRAGGALTNISRLERPAVDVPDVITGTPLAKPYAYASGVLSDYTNPEFYRTAMEGFRRPRQTRSYLTEELGRRPDVSVSTPYTGEGGIKDVISLGERAVKGTTQDLSRYGKAFTYDTALNLANPGNLAIFGAGNIGRGVQTALRGTPVGASLARGSTALNTFAKVLNTQPGSGAKLLDRFRYAMQQQPIDVAFKATTVAPEVAKGATKGARPPVPAAGTGFVPKVSSKSTILPQIGHKKPTLLPAPKTVPAAGMGKQGVITFKNTEDALAYGQKIKGNQKLITKLENIKKDLTTQVKTLAESGNEQAQLDAIVQKQFVNEALSQAKGKELQMPESVKKKITEGFTQEMRNKPIKRRLKLTDKSFKSNKRAIDQYIASLQTGKKIENPQQILKAFEQRAGKLRDTAPKSYAYFRNKIMNFMKISEKLNNKGFLYIGDKAKKKKYIENLIKSMPEIEKQAKASGVSLENYMKGAMFLPDDIVQKAITSIPIDIKTVKPKQFVKYATTKDLGQVIEVGDDFVRVQFAEGIAKYKAKDVPKLLRRVVAEGPPDITKKAVPNVEIQNLEALKKIKTKDLKLKDQVEVLNAALREAAANPKSRFNQERVDRLYKQVVDSLIEDEIVVKDLPKILEAHGLSKVEFAKQLAEEWSRAGRSLNQLSQLSKQIRKILPDKEIEKLLGRSLDYKPWKWDIFINYYKKIDRARRAFMVSQLGTAVRNAYSQGARSAGEAFDDALAGILQKITRTGIKGQRFTPFMEDIHALFRTLGVDKAKRRQLLDVLKQFPMQESRLLHTPTGEATLSSKALRILNWANVIQEYGYRRMAFDAHLSAALKKHGKTAKDIAWMKKNPQVVEEAINHALEITYALRPTEGMGAAIMKMYDAFPPLTVLGNPFARFYVNSYKFLYERSPFPALDFLSKAEREALRGPNSFKQWRKVAKIIEGLGYLHLANSVRNSDYAGEKWYQIRPDPKNPNRVIDIRPYAPLSFYFFITEAIKNPKRMSSADWMNGFLSLSRVAGTGLVLVDVFRSTEEKTFKNLVKQFAGQVLGATTVPAKTISDVVAEFNPEEAVMRSTREDLLTGPARLNVPGFVPGGKTSLPEFRSVLKGGKKSTVHPLLRQFGISLQDVNDLEREVNRLGISRTQPRTGDRKLDRLIAERAGPKLEAIGVRLVNSSLYKKWDDEVQEKALKALISFTKTEAREVKQVEDIDLFIEQKIEDIVDSTIRKVIKGVYKATPPILPGTTESGPSRPLPKILRPKKTESFPYLP